MEAKILLTFLISYLVGTASAPMAAVDISYLVTTAIALFVIGILAYKNRVVLVISFSLAFFLLAVANYEYRTDAVTEMANRLEDKKATFVVIIDDMPISTSFGQRAKAKIISVDNQQVSANVNVFTPRYPELEYGQKVKFDGKVSGFSETPGRYLKDGQIGSVSAYQVEMLNANNTHGAKYYLLKIRESFNKSVMRLLPTREANLAQGLIMGERAVFDDQFKTYLQNSGTTHIIALSGYNITIILGIFLVFRKYFSRLLNLIIPVVFTILFIIMTGASASIVRAGIMGLMPILARYLGRSSQSLIAIILSATLMVAINPSILLNDIGFQLSFAAIVGVVYLAPKIKFGNVLQISINSIFSETIAAQIATLPIIIYYFGSISLVSPLANVAILWMVPAAMFISFLVGVLGIFSSLLGTIVALPATAILAAINYLIELFGSLPYSARALEISNPVWILVYYLIIIDIFFIFKKGEHVRPT